MTYLLKVCLAVLALGATFTPSLATAHSAGPQAGQELRVGISVQLAATHNAVPIPEADKPGSLVVSVTRNGSVYVGTDPANLTEVTERLKVGRPGKGLYLKADARTLYASVEKVLEAVRRSGVDRIALLTGQRVTPKSGTLVPPFGLKVFVAPPRQSASRTVTVQLFDSGQGQPGLKINDESVPWGNLQNSLEQILSVQRGGMVVVKAVGTLPYADVVHLIDVCRSTGARVLLVKQLL